MLKVAEQNVTEAGFKDKIILLQADARNIPFENKFFDFVISTEMLHHLADPVPVLKEMKRVVKDTGTIIIRDLIRPPTEFILNLYVSIFGLPYNQALKKGYRESLYNAFSIEEWKELLKFSGIEKTKISVDFPHFINIVTEE
jgi:ubiquinone/menaquinone biosynthesis C-methylase UbiE